MELYALIIAIVLIATASAQPEGATSSGRAGDSATVAKVGALYDAGRLADAQFEALKALDANKSLTDLERSQLFQVLGFCAVANDEDDNARRYFVAALRVNPSLSPDPITWSPKVRRVFDRAREEFALIARSEAEQRASREADICRQASLRALYLPGAGQAMKEEWGKSWLVGSAFWLSMGVFLYAEAKLPAARADYRNAIERDEILARYKDYRNLSRLAVFAGGGVAASYTFSFFDALWSRPNPSLLEMAAP